MQKEAAMMRLASLNNHVKVQKAKRTPADPILNVWKYMNMDQYLSPKGAEICKNVQRVMKENYSELNQHYQKDKFPFFMLEKIYDTGVNGLMAGPEYGGPGINFMDMGAISFHMNRFDPSFATGFYVHNLTVYTILLYGSEEQK